MHYSKMKKWPGNYSLGRILFLALMVILPAAIYAQTSPIGYPNTNVCTGVQTAGANPGATATLPGRWWNPGNTTGQPGRPGTGWDVIYADGGNSVYLYWYTYDSTGRPIWYYTTHAAVGAGQSWWGDLIRRTQPGDVNTAVGQVAMVTYPSDPTKIALRWKLNGMGSAEDECIVDYFGAAGRGVNMTYSGSWYEPGQPGGINLTVGQQPTTGYTELAQLLSYDSLGMPVWLTSQYDSGVNPPPAALPAAQSVFYTYSKYGSTGNRLPTANNSNCVGTPGGCIGIIPAVGVWNRSFSTTTSGQFTVNVNQSVNTPDGWSQQLNWRRPTTGSGMVTLSKLTDATQIRTNLLNCTVPQNQDTCAVLVNWGVSQGGSGFAFRRNMGNQSVVLLSGAGEATDALPPGYFRYELRATSSPASALLALTHAVRVREQQPVTSNQVGLPDAATCNAVNTGTGGVVPLTPGLWWNPERNSTGWELTLINGGSATQSLLATWYTYDGQKRPTWLYTLPNQIQDNGNGNRTWWSPLIRYTWNAGAQTRNAGIQVGEVAVRFLPQEPTRAVVRWKWNAYSSSAFQDECILDFSRAGNRNVNAAFSGNWWESIYPGYLYQLMVGSTAGEKYMELGTLGIYDSTGAPVWVQAQRTELTTAPPLNETIPLSMNYYISPYPTGYPVNPCTSQTGCAPQVRAAGTMSRRFTSTVSVDVAINVAYQSAAGAPVQSISWNRPNAGGGTTTMTKLAAGEQITVNRTQCVAGDCAVVINVATGWQSSVVYRQQVDSAAAATRIPLIGTGEYTDVIQSAGRYRYVLRLWDDPSAPIVAYSADLIATTPELDDWSDAQVAPAPAAATVVELPSPAGTVEVGTVGGSFRVDEDGNATYAVPLLVAPATGNTAPEVSLQYNSSGPDGPLGVGFSLTGQSAITRCRRTVESGDGPGPHPPISFGNDDVYCLDGQRLLEAGILAGVGTVFRTEVDGLANIVAHHEAGVIGPARWSVWSKDGMLREYGLPENGGRIHRNANIGGAWIAQNDQVLTWNLSRITARDSGASVIEYEYAVDQTAADSVLTHVRYSAARNVPALATPSAYLEFAYAPRPEYTESYANGMRMRNGRMLHSVRSVNADGATLRLYLVDYQLTGQSPSGRPRVAGITETRPGQGAQPEARYPTTTFTWSAAGNYLGNGFNGTSGLEGILAHKYADINGDARTDLVWARPAPNNPERLQLMTSYATVNNANGSIGFSPGQCADPNFCGRFEINPGQVDPQKGWQLFDFNQDGLEDLLIASLDQGGQTGTWNIHLGTGGGFNPAPVALPSALGFSLPFGVGGTSLTDAALADFNGDGLIDLMLPFKRIDNTLGLRIYPMRPATQAFSCAVNSVPSNCPYEFAQPVELGFTTALGGAELKLYKETVNDLTVFDVDGDGLADLLLRVDCKNVYDCVGNARTEAGFDYTVATDKPTPEGGSRGGEHQYWVVFTHDSAAGSAMAQTFKVYHKWKSAGADQEVSNADNRFRMVDINGDALADAFYLNEGSQWQYQINTGNGYLPADCAAKEFSGSATEGLLCPSYDTLESNSLHLADFNGDGALDLWMALQGRGGAGSGERVQFQPFCRGQGLQGAPHYGVLLWSGAGFDGAEICDTSVLAPPVGWNSDVLDFDGNGVIDFWSYATYQTEGCSNGGCYRSFRDNSRWIPRDKVVTISNGLGAQTRIQYAPMTFSSVYRQDYNAPFMGSQGRGSAVFDLVARHFLVQMVESSAPNLSQPSDPWVRVAYRYAGAKIQAGGRGALGMRKVWSVDLQTQMETETEYYQAWPLTGRPKATVSRYRGSSPYVFGSCGTGPNGAPNGDLAGCMGRAPICNAATTGDLTISCDPAPPAGSLLASSAADTWGWRERTGLSTLSAARNAFSGSVPAKSVFVYQLSSVKDSHEINSGLSQSLALRIDTTTMEGVDPKGHSQPGYDGNGNLLGSSVHTRDLFGRELQYVSSTFTYLANVPLGPTWVSGLLSHTSVTHTRQGASKSRSTEYTYNPDGSVRMERVQPGGSLSEQLTSYTLRNELGQPTARITCSGHFATEAACTSGSQQSDGPYLLTGLLADPVDPLVVRRVESYAYDSRKRFINTTWSAFDDDSSVASASADTPARIRVASQVLGRSVYGAPTDVVDANNVRSKTLYSWLGAAYQQYVVGTGSSTLTTSSWCAGQAPAGGLSTVVCPAEAVYRIEVDTQGAPLARSYYDLLGREILRETQSFTAGQWSAVATGYDVLGRAIQVSEPYLSGGAERRLCEVGYPCTRQQYDIFGRPTLVIHPDDAPSRTVRTSINYLSGICWVQGSNSRCYTKQTYNAKGQLSVEHTSALGELAQNLDAMSLVMRYDYDAHGNPVRVERTPGNGDSSGQLIVNAASFDNLGRRLSMTDPDIGVRTAAYNAAGELIREQDANGQCTTSRYDVRGRLRERIDYTGGCSGSKQSESVWQYDVARLGLLDAEREVISSGYTRSFEYDALSRVVATVHQFPLGHSYRQEQTFDQYGRAFQSLDLVFAAGSTHATSGGQARKLGVQYQYTPQGHQHRVVNAQLPADVYYEVLEVNARGQVVRDRRGDAVALERQMFFDGVTGRLQGIQAGINASLQNWDYGLNNPAAGYDVLGNLLYRRDARNPLNVLQESFSYDSHSRLTGVVRSVNGVQQDAQAYSYDALGNLKQKSGQNLQSSSYAGITHSCPRTSVGPHMVTRASGSLGTTIYCYDNNGNQISATSTGNHAVTEPDQRRIIYAVHDKPLVITYTGGAHGPARQTRHSYGPNREIVRRREGPNVITNESDTHYAGGVEITLRPDNGSITERREYRRMIGNALIITLNSQRNSGVVSRSSSRLYRFEDKLGSIDVLADRAGNAVQRMSFDVWGERRDETTWARYTLATISGFASDKTRKGYTGHEHVDVGNIIHMGGRIYDPRIGRFLSADPIIQAPGFSQSYNRYSYVLNNPMNYVDPSGYSWIKDNWRTIASIAIAFVMPQALVQLKVVSGVARAALTGLASGAVQTGSLRGALNGAVSAAVFHGIGSYFEKGGAGLDAGDWAFKEDGSLTTPGRVAKVGAHAAAGGLMSKLQGGKFGHGFAAAGVVEVFSPAITSRLKDQPFKQFVAATVLGGTASRVSGGKFANGAVTAAFVWALNHDAHKREDKMGELTEEEAMAVALSARAYLRRLNELADKGPEAFFKVYPAAASIEPGDPLGSMRIAVEHMRVQLVGLGASSMKKVAHVRGRDLYSPSVAAFAVLGGVLGDRSRIFGGLGAGGVRAFEFYDHQDSVLAISMPVSAQFLFVSSVIGSAGVLCGGSDLDCGFFARRNE